MKAPKGKNGIRYLPSVRRKAIALRKAGKTHREIRNILGISLGTAGFWTKGIILSEKQKQGIQQRKTEAVFTPELRYQLGLAAREHLKPYQYKQKHTKSSLLKKIKEFYLLNNRIPIKREFGDPKVYRTYFGTWNKAIIEAGFKPNAVLFADRLVAKDGHQCDSFSECIIDDWLYEQGIKHDRSVRYGVTKMTADFSVRNNTVIEFFGLAGVQSGYDRIIKKKRVISKRLGLHLIEIYPEDLFPKNNLRQILQF